MSALLPRLFALLLFTVFFTNADVMDRFRLALAEPRHQVDDTSGHVRQRDIPANEMHDLLQTVLQWRSLRAPNMLHASKYRPVNKVHLS
uniref:Secreted protein n=1 Tax=Ascaris lumbricoides TaxID=6252 RepID=A0A0M3I936_ASCLU